MRKLSVLVTLLICQPVETAKAAGEPDPNFGTAGQVWTDITGNTDGAFAVALQPDGQYRRRWLGSASRQRSQQGLRSRTVQVERLCRHQLRTERPSDSELLRLFRRGSGPGHPERRQDRRRRQGLQCQCQYRLCLTETHLDRGTRSDLWAEHGRYCRDQFLRCQRLPPGSDPATEPADRRGRLGGRRGHQRGLCSDPVSGNRRARR